MDRAPPWYARAANLVQDARQQVLQALGLRMPGDDVRVGSDGGLDWPHNSKRIGALDESRLQGAQVGS